MVSQAIIKVILKTSAQLKRDGSHYKWHRLADFSLASHAGDAFARKQQKTNLAEKRLNFSHEIGMVSRMIHLQKIYMNKKHI